MMMQIALESEMSWNNICQDIVRMEAINFFESGNMSLNSSQLKATFEKIKKWIMEKIESIKQFIRYMKDKFKKLNATLDKYFDKIDKFLVNKKKEMSGVKSIEVKVNISLVPESLSGLTSQLSTDIRKYAKALNMFVTTNKEYEEIMKDSGINTEQLFRFYESVFTTDRDNTRTFTIGKLDVILEALNGISDFRKEIEKLQEMQIKVLENILRVLNNNPNSEAMRKIQIGRKVTNSVDKYTNLVNKIITTALFDCLKINKSILNALNSKK